MSQVTADTSVLVAAFCTWHERHADANDALAPGAPLISHCAVECFSVLTRLPPSQRVSAADASAWIGRRFPAPWLALSAGGYERLLARAPELRLNGGAICDGIVAATAEEAGVVLVSFDARALATYRAVGATVTLS